MKLSKLQIRGIESFVKAHGKVDSWSILSMLQTLYSLKAGDAAKVFMLWVTHSWQDRNAIFIRYPELRAIEWAGDEKGWSEFLENYCEVVG